MTFKNVHVINMEFFSLKISIELLFQMCILNYGTRWIMNPTGTTYSTVGPNLRSNDHTIYCTEIEK